MRNVALYRDNTNIDFIAKIFIGVIGLFAASQLSIPKKPIPINLGTIAVMIIGIYYSPKEVASTTIAYLALGVIGLPLFANFNGGLAYFCGPTGGYLVGYASAAWIMSILRMKYDIKNKILNIITLCTIGQAVIFALGIAWLSTYIGISAAIKSGFLVFILPGCAKILLLSCVIRFISKS